MTKVGLVGVGGYARYYFDRFIEFQQDGRIRLQGCVVRNPEKHSELLEQYPEIQLFPDLSSLLHSTDLDLVAIPAGIPFHVPMAMYALQHGAHVMVEKPVAGSTAAIDELMQASQEFKREVFVGFQHVHGKDASDLRKRIQQAGEIREIRLMGCWPRSLEYYQKNEWSGKLKLDGTPVLDSPVHNGFGHHLHLAMWLTGRNPISVRGDFFRTTPIESFDTAFGTAILEGDIPLKFWLTLACQRRIDPILWIDCGSSRFEWSSNHEVVDAARRRFFDLCLRRVEGRTDNWVCDLQSARTVTALAEMIHHDQVIFDTSPAEIMERPTAFGTQFFTSGIENRILGFFRG